MLVVDQNIEIGKRHNSRPSKELLHKSNPGLVMISIPDLQLVTHLAYTKVLLIKPHSLRD